MRCVLHPNGKLNFSRDARKFNPDPIAEQARLDEEQRLTVANLKAHGLAQATLYHSIREWEENKSSAALPGLVNSSLFPHSARRGGSALTRLGVRRIECGAAVLEREHGKSVLSFLTLTIPPWGEGELNVEGLKSAYDDFRGELSRKLRKCGLPFLLIGVIEPHPARSQKEGVAIPHFHLVFVGRKKYCHWAIEPHWLTATWYNCLLRSKVVPKSDNIPPCTNVQQVKKSVRRYLSKYLGKIHRGGEALGLEGFGSLHKISHSLLKLIAKATKVRVGNVAEMLYEWTRSGAIASLKLGEIWVECEDCTKTWVGGWTVLDERVYLDLVAFLESSYDF
jgi:hypothetical protein